MSFDKQISDYNSVRINNLNDSLIFLPKLIREIISSFDYTISGIVDYESQSTDSISYMYGLNNGRILDLIVILIQFLFVMHVVQYILENRDAICYGY